MIVHADGSRCDSPNADPFKLLSSMPSQTYYCGHGLMVYERTSEELQ